MARLRVARTLAIALVACVALVTQGHAQESGGSFGGSSWDDEPAGGGGGSDWGSSGGSSDWGSSGGGSTSSPADDWARQQAEQAERDREAERERQRQEEEDRRRRAAEEAERARQAAERARVLALPPHLRVRELSWPGTPDYPPVTSVRVAPIDAPLGLGTPSASGWVVPEAPPPLASPTHDVAGAWDGAVGFVCALPLVLLMLFAVFILTRLVRASSRRGGGGGVGYVGAANATTAPTAPFGLRSAPRPAASTALRISIAFDWTARARLQSELAAMATRFDMRTRPGLTDAARAITQLLDANAGAARYVTWELATGDARSWFQTRASDLRARFRAELVRNDTTGQADAYTAREHEGQGLVVVTVLAAGKTPIAPPNAAFDLASMRGAIASITPAPGGQIIALEVIWSPAAENDRMSSYELEKLYPELQRIAEGVGARQCAYCRGPFPTELGRCPNCGAPI